MKKLPRLPDTDLARIAPLPTTEKWRQLRDMRAGFPDFSYSPSRRHLPATMNAQGRGTLFDDLPDSPRDKLIASLRKDCRSAEEFASNEEVTGLLYDWIRANGFSVLHYDFGRLTLAAGYSVCFWTDAILSDGKNLLVLHPDFRRATAGYTARALRFAFSAMHHHIRGRGGDFVDIDPAIIRFPQPKNRTRSVRLINMPADLELFSYDELVAMTEETLSIWRQVCSENVEEARRRAAANDDLPLFRRAMASGKDS